MASFTTIGPREPKTALRAIQTAPHARGPRYGRTKGSSGLSAFTLAKLRVVVIGRQRLVAAAIVVLSVPACGPEAARTVLVEADTTGGAVTPADSAARPENAEIELADAESHGIGSESTAGAAEGISATRTGSRSTARRTEDLDRARGSGDAEDVPAAEPDESRIGDRPPPPILLPGDRVLFPAGTVLTAELRTPIHTATTMVGDRFAARLTQALAAGGRVVIPVGTLIEGRVTHVGNASEPGYIAFLHLSGKSVRLPDGRHLKIKAEVLDVTGQVVVERGRDGGRARGPAGARPGEAAEEARRSMLDSILIGLAGRALVARTADKEIIIASGTAFTLELVEPLEVATL